MIDGIRIILCSFANKNLFGLEALTLLSKNCKFCERTDKKDGCWMILLQEFWCTMFYRQKNCCHECRHQNNCHSNWVCLVTSYTDGCNSGLQTTQIINVWLSILESNTNIKGVCIIFYPWTLFSNYFKTEPETKVWCSRSMSSMERHRNWLLTATLFWAVNLTNVEHNQEGISFFITVNNRVGMLLNSMLDHFFDSHREKDMLPESWQNNR